jgi:hypothetical protein
MKGHPPFGGCPCSYVSFSYQEARLGDSETGADDVQDLGGAGRYSLTDRGRRGAERGDTDACD